MKKNIWYTPRQEGEQGLVIDEATGETIAVTYTGKDTAAFIVKACNSHDELLAALEGAQQAIRKALPFLPADDEAIFCGEWLDEINEAIAKAGG
jgi:hypothetical protein